MAAVAIYVRVSTDKQTNDRQISECRNFLSDDEQERAELYADVASGAKDGREDIQRLIDDIEDGNIDKVVTWEMSRISRRLGFTADFIDLCTEHGIELDTVNDMFPGLRGDGDMWDELMGKLMAWLMEFEREMIRERVKSGVQTAISEGKWVGRPPYGFSTDSKGYLVIEPDDYVSMQLAIETSLRNPNQSVNSVARHYGVPQSSLDRIMKDKEQRAMYLLGESEDERISEAISSAEIDYESEIGRVSEELDEIRGAIDDLAEEVRDG